jgi:hypothetical protein
VNPFILGVLSPNPANDQITIEYIAEDASSAYLMVTEQSSNASYNPIKHQYDTD